MEYKSRKINKLRKGISVVVPMFNEEKGAEKCVKEVMKVVNKLPLRSALIVVNDGSTDRTSKILNNLKSIFKDNYFLVEYRKNKGYGGAFRMGIKESFKRKFKYVIVYDSDLTNHPKHIKEFARHYGEDLDFIKGSRFINGGGMKGVPFMRTIVTNTGNFAASNLFKMGIKDCTNGLRMVKTDLLIKIPYKENSFPIILEELYYLKKFAAKGMEIPNILTSRINTSSSFRYTPKLLLTYFKYAFKAYFTPYNV